MSFIPQATSARPQSVTVYPEIESDTYEARIVRIVALGMQEKTKLVPNGSGSWMKSTLPKDTSHVFQFALQFELIGLKAAGAKWELENGKWVESETYAERPSCVFNEYYVYAGGTRGNLFDLCQAIDPSINKIPNNLEWFKDKMLGAPVNITLKSSPAKRTPEDDSTGKPYKYWTNVKGTSGMSKRSAMTLPQAESAHVFFDCYTTSIEMDKAYAELPQFQRDKIAEAYDAANIPLAGTEPKNFDVDDEAVKPHKEDAITDDFEDDIPF